MLLPENGARRELGRLLAILLLTIMATASARLPAAPDAQVEAVQRRLAELGYDPGVADGFMGSRTRAALRALQEDRGLPVSARIDADTLGALGLSPASPAEAVSAPARRYDTVIPYERLGWAPPASAETVRQRFRASRDAPLRARIDELLIVPNPERIYILARGESLSELPCDPAAAGAHAELMLYPGGPVLFTPQDEGGLCQLGLGVVLSAGRSLMLEAATWEEFSSPAGRVRLGERGLEFQ